MSITLTHQPLPRTARTVESKYSFEQLVVGGPCLADTEVIDVKKATSRMTSALAAYRKRTGDKSRFSTRPFKNGDGSDAVGVWKVKDAPVAAEAAAE